MVVVVKQVRFTVPTTGLSDHPIGRLPVNCELIFARVRCTAQQAPVYIGLHIHTFSGEQDVVNGLVAAFVRNDGTVATVAQWKGNQPISSEYPTDLRVGAINETGTIYHYFCEYGYKEAVN